MIGAVLFDVGGAINTEIEHERLVDAAIRAALAAEGIAVSGGEYAAACAWAVERFAPDAHAAIIWRPTHVDAAISARVYAAFRDAMHAWPAFELRDGIGEVLAWLHGRGLRLGLAANQPHATLAVLDAHGIGGYFHHREVSGTHGFRKPDARLSCAAAMTWASCWSSASWSATASTTTSRPRSRSACAPCCSARAAMPRSSRVRPMRCLPAAGKMILRTSCPR